MSDLVINEFRECQRCADCCKETPCDLIPADLPPLLDSFEMSLPDFFKRYLIALIIASPKHSDEILMMVPVRVEAQGIRTEKLLADNEYLRTPGKCIFLEGNKCTIHESKPFGGRYLKCPKMTGTVTIQLPKDQYFAYWANNQHLFYSIFPGFQDVFDELSRIYQRKNAILPAQGKNEEYDRLDRLQVHLIKTKLFPLFNNSPPIDDYTVLYGQ